MKKYTIGLLCVVTAICLTALNFRPQHATETKTTFVVVTPAVAPVATKVLKRHVVAKKSNPTQDALDQFGLKLANSFGVSAHQQSQPQP
jgi:hypothetical protein